MEQNHTAFKEITIFNICVYVFRGHVNLTLQRLSNTIQESQGNKFVVLVCV